MVVTKWSFHHPILLPRNLSSVEILVQYLPENMLVEQY